MDYTLLLLPATVLGFILSGLLIWMVESKFLRTRGVDLEAQRKEDINPEELKKAFEEDIPAQPSTQEGTCIVCLDQLKLGDQCCELSCQHRFHQECLYTWWARGDNQRQHYINVSQGKKLRITCPTCRQMHRTDQELGEDEEIISISIWVWNRWEMIACVVRQSAAYWLPVAASFSKWPFQCSGQDARLLFEDHGLQQYCTSTSLSKTSSAFSCLLLCMQGLLGTSLNWVKVCWNFRKTLNFKIAIQHTDYYRSHHAFSWFLASNLSTLLAPWPGNQFFPCTTWRFQGHAAFCCCFIALPSTPVAEAIVIAVRVRDC